MSVSRVRENRTHGSMRGREALRCRWPSRPKGPASLPPTRPFESADRSRADTCFAVAEQASEEAGPARFVLVPCGNECCLRGDDSFHAKRSLGA